MSHNYSIIMVIITLAWTRTLDLQSGEQALEKLHHNENGAAPQFIGCSLLHIDSQLSPNYTFRIYSWPWERSFSHNREVWSVLVPVFFKYMFSISYFK